MGGDIEAFLRMAAERRRQAQAGGQAMPAQQAPQQAPQQPVRQRQPEQRQPEQRPAPVPRPATEEHSVPARPVAAEFDPYAQASDLPERANSVRSKPKEKSRQQSKKGQSQTTTATTGQHQMAPSKLGSKKSDADSVHDQPQKTYANLGDQVVRLITEPSTVASAMILSEILTPRAFTDWED